MTYQHPGMCGLCNSDHIVHLINQAKTAAFLIINDTQLINIPQSTSVSPYRHHSTNAPYA